MDIHFRHTALTRECVTVVVSARRKCLVNAVYQVDRIVGVYTCCTLLLYIFEKYLKHFKLNIFIGGVFEGEVELSKRILRR